MSIPIFTSRKRQLLRIIRTLREVALTRFACRGKQQCFLTFGTVRLDKIIYLKFAYIYLDYPQRRKLVMLREELYFFYYIS